MVDLLARALALLARNFSFFPVPRPRAKVPAGERGDGKVPAMAWREFQGRVPTLNEITRWFSGQPMNIAIVTGHISDLVVVDVDSQDALACVTRHLPYTPWQVQTRHGFHLYYRHPGRRVPNRARVETGNGRLAVDFRGDGGYVIAAGSIHASGVEYREAGDWTEPREAVPVFSPDWLERPNRQPDRTRPVPHRAPTGEVVETARRYLAVIPRPDIGHGSDAATFYAACRLVRGFELSEADAIALLWEWAGGRPGWTHEWVARKVRHAMWYGTEPIGALR